MADHQYHNLTDQSHDQMNGSKMNGRPIIMAGEESQDLGLVSQLVKHTSHTLLMWNQNG